MSVANNNNKNKKIRIMSMQRIVNYGSYLQAYALNKMISNIGYSDVGFIDYEYETDLLGTDSNRTALATFKKNKSIRCVIHKLMFRHKYKMYLKTLEVGRYDNSRNVDTLVIGSDEVFNCLQHYPVGYSRNLFGYGFEDKNVLSYAASFGHTTLEQLRKYNIDKEIGEMLSRFSAISVRDDNSKKIVEALTEKKATVNCDPVLVGDYGDVMNKKIKINNYIIVYAYAGRLSKEENEAIKKFAKENNKKIISLGFYQECADKNIITKPLDVLAYFNNADYVITDTFHGSVFSIKTNTKFCAIVRDSNKNKLTSLLAKVKCEKQIAYNITDIWNIYKRSIDFSETNKVIASETEKAKEYLRNNL